MGEDASRRWGALEESEKGAAIVMAVKTGGVGGLALKLALILVDQEVPQGVDQGVDQDSEGVPIADCW
jgi:hypothetical protein